MHGSDVSWFVLQPCLSWVVTGWSAKPTAKRIELATQHAPTECKERIMHKMTRAFEWYPYCIMSEWVDSTIPWIVGINKAHFPTASTAQRQWKFTLKRLHASFKGYIRYIRYIHTPYTSGWQHDDRTTGPQDHRTTSTQSDQHRSSHLVRETNNKGTNSHTNIPKKGRIKTKENTTQDAEYGRNHTNLMGVWTNPTMLRGNKMETTNPTE